ncbi:MAG TPA: adenylate/guanylate cyclase domain-containing protein [Pseudonocardia sp.]|jgi:class 3 adenylate cyclase
MTALGDASATDRTTLSESISALDHGRLAAQVFDASGRLVWVSPQLIELVGAEDPGALNIGEHFSTGIDHPAWQHVLTPESRRRLRTELERHLDNAAATAPIWVFPLDIGHRRHRAIGGLGITLRHNGGIAGVALIYAPSLPARVLALVATGDEGMFTRMAELVTPAPRPAAVLFADIGASAVLSRHLPTGVYFELIQRFTTAFDTLVAEHGGIVGKHAGDGASAFFLTEHHPHDSAAARAALQTVYLLPATAHGAAATLAASGVHIDPTDITLNIGVHWGPNLYIGQIVTGSRLEVTALGDEVNECARVEQVATGGQVLATKTLIERLTPADAAALSLDQQRLTYTALADIAGDNVKALRDAGTLAVTELSI